jgi:hypothetical protein
MTVAAERLAAFALEIKAGGIEDRQPDIVEQAAASGEQLLLDQILVGAQHGQEDGALDRKFELAIG